MGTPSPRGSESTQPGRVSAVRNVTTPSGSGLVPGRPTVREAEFSGGRRMVQEAKAGAPKGNRKLRQKTTPPLVVEDNWPDTARVAGPKGS